MDFGALAVGFCGIAASLIVGFGGIVVAALTFYLSYRERISPMRGELYSRKLDAYAEVLRAMYNAYHDTQFAFFVIRDFPNEKNQLARQISLATKELAAADAVFNKFATVLSSNMLYKIMVFIGTTSKILSSIDPSTKTASDTVTIDPTKYRDFYWDLIQTARRELGTEVLTRETIDMVSKVGSQRSEDQEKQIFAKPE